MQVSCVREESEVGPLPLSGKVVVVAGASAGIGLQHGKEVREEAGATVIMLARDKIDSRASCADWTALWLFLATWQIRPVCALLDIAADFGRIECR